MKLFDHPFGHDAVARASGRPWIRHVVHGDERVAVEHDGEVALVLNLTGDHRVSGRMDGTPAAEEPRVNSVTVMSPGCRFEFEIEGRCRILAVTVPIEGLPRPTGATIRPRLNAVDPVLAGLIWRTATSSDGEAALSLLMRHLVDPGRGRQERAVGGIPAARLRRVTDAIEAGLAGPLPLADLAGVAGMSLFHFARAFAASTGTPPHRYVVGRRVARAIALLVDDASVHDVAARCGFANASHLAFHLSRETGLPPMRARAFAS